MSARSSSSVTSRPVLLTIAVFAPLSLIVAGFRLSLPATLAALPIALALAYALVRASVGMPPTIKGNLLERRYGNLRYQLVAMPINHFGERLRWCMDLIGAGYEETNVGGILSVFVRGRTVPWLVDRQSRSLIGNSEEALWFLSAVHTPLLSGPAQEQAAALLRRDPETMRWEAQLNGVGHAVQGWAYFYFLGSGANPDHSIRMWGGRESNVPLLQRLALRLGYPLWRVAMRKAFNLGDLALHARRKEIIDRAIDEVESALERSGGPFLFGEHMSYVDVSFCSLVGPLMRRTVVPLWARGRFKSLLPLCDSPSWPVPLTEFEEQLAARPCGRYIARMYGEWRCASFAPGGLPPVARPSYLDILPR